MDIFSRRDKKKRNFLFFLGEKEFSITIIIILHDNLQESRTIIFCKDQYLFSDTVVITKCIFLHRENWGNSHFGSLICKKKSKLYIMYQIFKIVLNCLCTLLDVKIVLQCFFFTTTFFYKE